MQRDLSLLTDMADAVRLILQFRELKELCHGIYLPF